MMTRLNVVVPDDLYNRFKSACALKGKTMTEAIIGFIRAVVEP